MPDELEASLRRLVYHDRVTGLPNRTAMLERIEAAVQDSRREGTSTALVLVDIDGFRLINETLGQSAGEELLRLVANRLRGLCDDRVRLGHHGGDEFSLLVGDLPRDPAAIKDAIDELGERLRAAFGSAFTVARSSFEIGASAGGSVFPLDAGGEDELLQHADQASHVAKRRGGGQVAMFERSRRHSLLELEGTLRVRRALAGGEFELYYQPVVEIADGGGLGGLEALLRWNDPDRGVLAPGAFLPQIERSPLLEEIGEWVFGEVCRQLAEWSKRGFDPRISFNIPARQLKRTGFADYVVDTAERHGADLTRLAAEIIESSTVELEEVVPTLNALCDAGLVLSLDDFGTGFSSLARLRSMPFTLLKTDRSFMSGIPGDRVAEELLGAVIALGKTLGMRVIVEGVETAEQQRRLLGLGCRVAQGFHLGRPAPARMIEARWHAGRTAAVSRRLDLKP